MCQPALAGPASRTPTRLVIYPHTISHNARKYRAKYNACNLSLGLTKAPPAITNYLHSLISYILTLKMDPFIHIKPKFLFTSLVLRAILAVLNEFKR